MISIKFELAALTLPGIADPAIAIAASRAGALGIVDVSFVRNEQRAIAAVTRLAELGRNRCGVRLDPLDETTASAVISALPPGITLAILTAADHDVLRRQADLLRARDVTVWLEARTLEQARFAAVLGVDGVVAKGHEAGGLVAETTTFVLLQQLLAEIELPVWAQGGIGERSVAACAAAGAAGAVLDAQLALTRESRLPAAVQAGIARMDGSETVCTGPAQRWRLFGRPGGPALEGMRRLERTLARAEEDPGHTAAWHAGLRDLVAAGAPEGAWLLGQDAALAAGLAARFNTVSGVLTGLRRSVEEHLAVAAKRRPLTADGPLARSHGTRYPLVQGPMTRVSDVPGFAGKVAEAGALPFLALAVMRGEQAEDLLRRAQAELGERPWGVGILGFVPAELRAEQLAAIKRYPPSFALIAGGRPDQALDLEQAGIPTYLHTPSPGLLRLFAEAGARRFVLEGRECGGHVGPRTSFVLWDMMIDTLLGSVPPADLADCHVLFAGGVHDARSAAMVTAMAATLAERGVKVGALLGTAYLFTEEAVSTGAITAGFQREALRCTGTVLLESGPGHATRCADTPFAAEFRHEQQRLAAEACPAEELRERLERLNLGRLRIASKGLARNPGPEPGAPELVELSADEQAARGLYMLGQVAALREKVLTLDELHHDICVRGSALLDTALLDTVSRPAEPARTTTVAAPCDIAIIGMSCLLPKAPTLTVYWHNILDKLDAITEIPPDRWDWQRHFDPDPKAPDKIYSRWGGFLDKVHFDPVRYGMPPESLRSIEPLQLLTLEAVRAALEDAGYADRPFPRQHTGVILGAGAVSDLGNQYSVRAALPSLVDTVPAEVLEALPAWTEDSFPGILPNVAAGRVANRFDLGGINHTVDAACASSLAAVYLAVRELETGTADMMIVGGADTMQTPFGYLCFSKTPALSPRGRCRPFDASADGIVISEGIGIVVLKRLADAERDGDRVYAVIKGIGASSDGRDRGLTAPRPEGQALALQRAYARAGFSPAMLGLIEAHGTGTVLGDRTEAQTLTEFLSAAGAPARSCAIGSVKSMIGHTKVTAGVAGVIKVALGLHHKVLPPTMGIEQPNAAVSPAGGPLYVNTESRPWLRAHSAAPRRAGVSAFGFGGTNFHVALEEYPDGYLPDGAAVRVWPSELLCWTAASRGALRERLDALEGALASTREDIPLRELAHAVWQQDTRSPIRLAVVASSVEDLRSKLGKVRDVLASGAQECWDRTGIYLTGQPLAGEAALAFLYPGQGSQRPGMLAELAIQFSEVREAFERADGALAERLTRPLSSYIFPPPTFSSDGAQAQASALTRTDRAQPALGAAGMGLTRLLAALGVHPELVAGHSYGEYVALCSAGVLTEDALYRLSQARGRCIIEAAEQDLGTMAAVPEGPERVREILAGLPQVWVANLNTPRQTVLAGTGPGIEHALERLAAAGIAAQRLPVSCAFHSPLVAPARDWLAQVLSAVPFAAPRLGVYSNTLAAPYPSEPARIAKLLADHLVRPVRFAEQIEQMYAAGTRVFVEVGPGAVLTGLVSQVLGERPHLAVATQGREDGLTTFQHALAQLCAHGVGLDLDRLYQGRVGGQLRLDALDEDLRPPPLSPTTWLVDGGSAVPLHSSAAAAEPALPTLLTVPASRIDAGGGEPGADVMMLRFQQLMTKFLDTQHEIMTAYLNGSRASADPAALGETAAALGAAPPPAPVPAVAPPAPEIVRAEGSSPSAEQVASELVRLLAERTGYPPEMLGVDADLEADLGIDSIKRVEVLGAAQQALWPGTSALSGDGMEVLIKARTLRALGETIVGLLSSQATNGSHLGAGAELRRFVPISVDAPLGALTRPLPGVVVITDDEQGVAGELAALLRARGIEVALVQDRAGTLELGAGGYSARLGDAESARALVEAIHQHQGAISALVHLLPLRAGPSFDDLDVSTWRARLDLETRSLFHLAQAASGDLRRVGHGTRLLAAVRLDGAFGYRRAGSSMTAVPLQPSQGGVAGLVKTLALEWPELACRVVDLDPVLTNPAELLAAELDTDDERVEVGWSAGHRVTVGLAPEPLPVRGNDQPLLEADSVLLVTGGARGITAAVTCELARRHQPVIIIVGRSAMPSGPEEPDTAGITDPKALRAALTARLRRDAASVTPSQVELAYRRLLADREMSANVQAMTAAGARVHYHQVDVTDPAQFARFVDDTYAWHGRIDGVIHGAGVIEDKLIEDKTSASFDRVVHTKTLGAFVLAHALRPEHLRFLVLFSSISARFGNPGQGDYAAANEVLNKLATELDGCWPARVVSLLWGPWRTAGMVSAEVERQFNRRGIHLITPDRGVAALIDELQRGRKGDTEVVLNAGQLPIVTPAPRVESFPLLGDATVTAIPDGIEVTRLLDPDRDRYLGDHRLDGHPVLPAAAAMELMAEVAVLSRPGYEVAELRDVHVLAGVILDGGPRPITVRASAARGTDGDGAVLEVSVVDAGRVSYRAEVVLRSTLPTAPPHPAASADGLVPFPMPLERAYDELLFQGPLLRGITGIEGMDGERMLATLAPSSPGRCVSGASGRWIVDPVLIDSGFQLCLLWARTHLDTTPLPARIRRYRRFAVIPEGPVRCEVRAQVRTGGHILNTQYTFLDAQGHLLAVIEDMEGACSRSLNRLAGATAGGGSR